jgi:hypothetical protein
MEVDEPEETPEKKRWDILEATAADQQQADQRDSQLQPQQQQQQHQRTSERNRQHPSPQRRSDGG